MFYTIPNEKDVMQTQTPAGVKSINWLFFESKNDSVFEYKPTLDMVSIIIDGKQICRNLPVLPFMTSQPYGTRKHRWEDVALAVNLNVNFSEIKINLIKDKDSNVGDNDFNIVFVCSDKECDEADGFDFIETKKIKLKGKYFATVREARTYLQNAFRTAHETWLTAHADWQANETAWDEYETAHTAWETAHEQYLIDHEAWEQVEQAWATYEDEHQAWEEGGEQGDEPQPPETPRYDEPTEEAEPTAPETPRYTEPVDPYSDDYELEIPTGSGNNYKKDDYRLLYEQMDNSQTAFEVEQAFTFDGIVKKMFAFPIYSMASKYNDNALGERVINSDIHYSFTLSGVESEIVPPKTDLCIFSATEIIPWRKSLLDFEENARKSILVTLHKNDTAITTAKGLEYSNIDLYLCFTYKKLN